MRAARRPAAVPDGGPSTNGAPRGRGRSGASPYRRLLAGGLAALVAGAGLAATPAIAAAAAPQAATTADATFNPFDNAGGFSVYVRRDANLRNTEIEGAIAVGGTLTVGGRLPVLQYRAGTDDYTPPLIEGDVTRALLGAYSPTSGVLDMAGDGGATPASGYAKLTGGPQAPFQFSARGGYTQYVKPGGEAEGPSIDAKNQEWDSSDPGATFRTTQPTVASYVEKGDSWDAVDGWLAQITDPASGLAQPVTVTRVADRAVLDLTPGVMNVLDYSALMTAGTPNAISYTDAQPSAETPLIIRVPAGTQTVVGMPLGNAGLVAPFVTWDLSAVNGSVSMAPNNGNGRIDGSVYAPHADLTLTFGPIDGQVIANTLTTTSGSGEMHAYFLRSTFTKPQVETTPDTTGSFSVAKALDGPIGLIPAGTSFTVHYRVDGGDPIPLAIPSDGTPKPVAGLPAGATITFAEDTPPEIDGITWTGSNFSTESIVIAGGITTPVTLTNTYAATPAPPATGSFTVAKALSGPTGLIPDGSVFTVDYRVDGGDPLAVTVPADGTPQTVAGLPDGAEVTFVERTPAAIAGVIWTDSTFSPATIHIVGGAATPVTVTNTFEAAPPVPAPTGSFTVAKALAGPIDLIPAGTTFTVDYRVDGGDPIAVTVPADGSPQTVAGLPDGTEVTFEERTPAPIDGVTWIDSNLSTESIDIVGGVTTPVTVTNTFEATPAPAPATGSFTVAKALAVPTGSIPDGTTFTVNYRVGDGDAIPLSIPADGTPQTVSGLPAGAVVTFEESTPAPIPGLLWTAGTLSERSISIVGGISTAVIVTNTYEATPSAPAPTGSVGISIEIDAPDGLIPDGTEVEVTYEIAGGEPITISVPADGSVFTIEDLPLGTTITFTELRLPGIDGVTWTGNDLPLAPIEVTGDLTTAVTVTTSDEAISPTPTPNAEPTPAPAPISTPDTTAGTTPLASTGVELAASIGVAAGALALGALGLLFARRRRTTRR